MGFRSGQENVQSVREVIDSLGSALEKLRLAEDDATRAWVKIFVVDARRSVLSALATLEAFLYDGEEGAE